MDDFLIKLSQCDELDAVNKARLEILASQVIIALKRKPTSRTSN